MKSKLLILAISIISTNAIATNYTKHDLHEIRALATAIHHEARGESLAGKKAVANVIMNRVKHKEFPNTVRAVISQRGQFQWYHNKKLRASSSYTKETEDLAQAIYKAHRENKRVDNTKGSIFFSSNGRRPAGRAIHPIRIGGHVFYKLKDKNESLQQKKSWL